MKRAALFTGLFMSAALMSATASAGVVTVGLGTPGQQVSTIAATTYDFDTTFATFNPAANAQVVIGTTANFNATPFGDSTYYVTIGTDPSPGSASLVLNGATTYLGLLWGSVDTYNSITITDADGSQVINSATFPILAPATGDQGPGGTQYVNIFDTIPITAISFSSSQRAFEMDNIALVPETSTWAMMLLGFAGLGFMAYRRKETFRLA